MSCDIGDVMERLENEQSTTGNKIVKLLPWLEVHVEWKEVSLVSMWHNDGFNTGEENTKDLPCSGRPKLCDIENIRRVLE